MNASGGIDFRHPPGAPHEPHASPTPRHEFFARNDSDRIYRVTRVTLTGCRNVRECGSNPVDVVLCPGETRRIFASRPFDAERRIERERVHFNWGYGASSYEPGEPVVGADCGREE